MAAYQSRARNNVDQEIMNKTEYYRNPKTAETYDNVRYTGSSGKYVLQKEMGRISQFLSGVKTILDLPAGTGKAHKWLSSGDRQVIGVDSSFPMLKCAQAYENKRTIADASMLPFPDNSFDCVVMLRFLFHFAEPECFIKEAARVLKKDGILIFETYTWSLLFRDFYIPKFLGGRNYCHSKVEIINMIDKLKLNLQATQSDFIFSPTCYRFFPIWFHKTLEMIERLLPESIRVSKLWILKKAS